MIRLTASLPVVSAFMLTLSFAGCSLFHKPGEDEAPPPARAPAPSSVPPSAPGNGPRAPSPPAAPVFAPPPPAQPTPRNNHLSPATRALVDQAHGAMAQGDLPGASSTLDRALRIEPSNPLLWIEIGRLRLAENDAHQAESCGRKALVLASGDPAAQSQSAQLVAEALRLQGRNQEAREVEKPYER